MLQNDSNVTHLNPDQEGEIVDKKTNEFDVANQEATHKQKLVEIGETLANIDDADIQDACQRLYDEVYMPRKKLNELRAEIVEPLKDAGLSPQAFNAAFSRYVMDPYRRDEFDRHMGKCSNAMDVQPKLL